MRVFVTGHTGLVGTDVCPELEACGLTLCHGARVDVTDGVAVLRAIEQVAPDWILHLAAFTDVDGAEAREAEAARVNVDGCRHVAEAAARIGSRLLVVSTDYVYPGDKDGPYVESDPVGPISAYGRTKLAGEQAAQAILEDVLIVRTAWVYGRGGKNFVDTIRRLAAERPTLDVVDDQHGCPTYTRHLARGLRQLIEAGATGIVHVAGHGQTTWYALAREILRCTGDDPDRIRPTTSAAFPRPAPRPANSVLADERFAEWTGGTLPPWEDAVGEYLAG